MLGIILGILGIILLIVSNYADNYGNCRRLFAFGFGCLFCAGIFAFSMFAPNEYEDKRDFVSSTELVTIVDGENIFLLESDQTISYAYINQMLKKEVTSLSKEDCAIIEEEDCTMPRVEKYERKIKKEWYRLSIGGPKIEYVVYVPVGSIGN